jgi:hypothetical protein
VPQVWQQNAILFFAIKLVPLSLQNIPRGLAASAGQRFLAFKTKTRV